MGVLDGKIKFVESCIFDILGDKYGEEYMGHLLDKINEQSELKEYLRYSTNSQIKILIESEVLGNITVVKDTRLARKMYPKFKERGDGMLIIEILGEG